MQEIWLLQSRFSLRQRKRVMRMLSHPRFRAAFDFLGLRLVASNEHAEDVEFWREAQQHPDHIEAMQSRARAAESDDDDGGEGGDRPRKRRRRRRTPVASGE
jgi:poly(A) polymerase